MSTDTSTSLRLVRTIEAAPEQVFRAWTEPAQIKRWACPAGGTVLDAQVDLTVGGEYRITMQVADGSVHTAVGVYQEVVRPKRLVYTWDWEEGPMGDTLVTVEFVANGSATDVVLKHERFPNGAAREQHEVGWASCLEQFERVFD